jgi:polar amino acid transport system substrate-binding protein
MRLTKFLRVGAVAATLALAAAACGGDEGGTVTSEGEGSVSGTGSASGSATGSAPADDESPADDGAAAAGDLQVVNDGQLTVCSDIPYAPFEMENEEGTGYTGFDIELMRAIAADLGLELNVSVTAFDAIQSGTALGANACDVAASAMTITEDREENVDFADPYFDADQSLLVRGDAGIGSLDDISTLGVQADTTGQAYAQENFDGEIIEYPGAAELFSALAAGNIEGILQDLPVNAERAQQDDSLEVLETFPTGEQYGFAVAEGNTTLRDAINEALAGLREDGTYDELYAEYFQA